MRIAARIAAIFLLAACSLPAQKIINYEKARKFWSFQPLKETPVQSIDQVIHAALEKAGLKPSPPADPRTLIRRVYFDLIGLPPSAEDVTAFVNSKDPNAYRKLVDKLLASPQYGERWGRHWLDLVRFAETDGHEFDVDKPNAWRYRDYVIQSFNDDVPYKRFVEEQLAGDLLPDRKDVGTGFYWLGEVINTPVDSVQATADRIDNQIDVIGKAFLGLTVACARCHDHKFDPIPTSDYYALAGILHSSRIRQVDRNDPGVELRYEKQGQFEWQFTGPAFRVVDGKLTSGAVSDALQGIAISNYFNLEKRYLHILMRGPGQVRLSVDEYKDRGRFRTGDATLSWKTIDVKMSQGRSAYLEVVDETSEGSVDIESVVQSDSAKPPPIPEVPPTPRLDTAAKATPSEFVLGTTDYDPHNIRVHVRGSHKNLGAEVDRKFLTILSGENQPAVQNGSGRRELARRITEDSSALLARVMVNRIWQHHFGQGLVRTPDNFGLTGERPTHPELLEWLAAQFQQNGWRMKPMHRMMLLSETYRMASTPGQKADDADPENKLLHRMPVRRLEAEAIRDNVLAISGSLDLKMYGPSVAPFVSPYMDGDSRGKPKSGPLDGAGRRSIYIQVRRNYLSDSLLVFDYPPPISTIGKRNVSSVPSQALYFLNSDFVIQQAAHWAARLSDLEPEKRVERMYLEAFARPPEPDEIAAALAFTKDHSWSDYAHVLMNTTEFIFLR